MATLQELLDAHEPIHATNITTMTSAQQAFEDAIQNLDLAKKTLEASTDKLEALKLTIELTS